MAQPEEPKYRGAKSVNTNANKETGAGVGKKVISKRKPRLPVLRKEREKV